jgi:hypothetical protein
MESELLHHRELLLKDLSHYYCEVFFLCNICGLKIKKIPQGYDRFERKKDFKIKHMELKYNMVEHILKEHKEKCMKCNICSKLSVTDYHLEQHKKNHIEN